MSEIYSKYLSLNESKSVGKSPSKKSVKKSLKEDRWEGYEEAKEVFYDAEVGEVWIGNVIEGDDTFTMYLEGDSEEDIEKAIDNVCNHYEKNAEKYPLVLSVDGDVEAGAITFFIEVGDEELEESKKKVSLKNKKKLSESDESVLKVLKNMYDENELKDGVSLKYNKKEKSYFVKTDGGAEYSLNTNDLDDALMKFYKKEILSDKTAKRNFEFFKNQLGESKKKAIKEWRRNISGYSEISDEEVKKYQSELDEIGGKLEKSGISVKKVGQVNVEEFEGSDDYFTEEAWGHIELSKPVKDEDEFEKICDIVEPYIDNRLSDVKDIGYVGSEDLYITFKVVDRFWDDEELEESSRKKSRFSKKRLSEKDSKTFNKAFKDFESLVRGVAKAINIGIYIDDIWTNSEREGKVIVDFEDKAPSQKVEALMKTLEDDIRVEKITKKQKGNGFVVIFKEKYRNLEESIKNRKNDMQKKISLFKSKNNTIKESSKRKSFKEFKKLKESRKKLSKRKLNESDSVSIEITFDNYRDCLRAVFKEMGKNLNNDQLNWFTELGMEMAIDPNSMYIWILNEVELFSVDDIKHYKDLGDVSDEEAIDFAREKGYYEGEVNGDTYFLVPLGE